ncbi:hypothetical protein [Prosthecobacter vanneervenii]|uniref:Uncharacterized protein n=1 Tax=Prosthecobacter vanneervenii TaxID=48466 RepID=A0A7W8DK60_9BACT|nr:hypothetical protein [Prosthecobacter vanneervenii]MBB5032720.1 hypothetical protein [Prosthecobacter vanneervenii]
MSLHTPFTLIALLLLSSATLRADEPKPDSEFTTTDPKKVKILEDSSREKDTEIDHFRHLCPGLGGYQIIHEGGDLRSWINLIYDGGKTDLMNDTLSACPGQFPAKANNVVQWRGFRKGGSFMPYAVIYRMMSSADDAKQTRLETLVIIKLDGRKSRVVGHVDSKEGNEKAEILADKLCMP